MSVVPLSRRRVAAPIAVRRIVTPVLSTRAFALRARSAPLLPIFPVTSQIDGELRELRVRFARTRYRLLYQRSGNLVVLLHAFEKNTGAVPARDRETAKRRMADFRARMDAERRRPPRAAGRDAPPKSRRG
jgi:Phage derived protein Gp49-like (DUF891)